MSQSRFWAVVACHDAFNRRADGSRLCPQIVAAAAFLLIGLGTASAQADIPPLQVSWKVNDVVINDYMPSGTDLGNGTFNYADNLGGGGDPTFSFNLTGDPNLSGAPLALVSGNLVVENLTQDTIDVELLVVLPLSTTFEEGSMILGSAAIGFTSAGAGTVSSFGGNPVWQALIDGSPVGEPAELFDDPFSIVRTATGSSSGGSQNFGLPVPVPGPAATDSIGIRIRFSLTPLDQASMTSVFRVVPGPTTLFAIAVGLAFVQPRRRRVADRVL